MPIKLVENYAVNQARQDVRDSLQAHGERCIVMSMYHRFNDPDKPMCPYCTDDIYTDSGEPCSICWGTGVQGGLKQASKVWGMFTDSTNSEDFSKRGVWQPDQRDFQTEAFPVLLQHDYVIRVRRWNLNNTPAEIEGFYAVMDVTLSNIRTGTRFGQSNADIVGQTAKTSKLSESATITKFPVIGVQFSDAVDPYTPATLLIPTLTPANQTTRIDQTVHAYTIGDGESTTITINHMLGTTNLVIQLYDAATGEQLDTNITASTILLLRIR